MVDLNMLTVASGTATPVISWTLFLAKEVKITELYRGLHFEQTL